MKLYYAPHMASSAVLITALELGIELEMVQVDMTTRRLDSGTEYTTINPKGLIPALELESGRILTETPAIMLYLASRSPGTSLVPEHGSEDYYRLLEWMSFFSSELHKFYTFLFWDGVETFKPAVADRILGKFITLEKMVGGGYLVGGRLTLADIYLFINARALHLLGTSIDQYPKLARVVGRVQQLPSVTAALALHG